jgi:hypothetical protein
VIIKFEAALEVELGALMVKFLVIATKLGVHKEQLGEMSKAERTRI